MDEAASSTSLGQREGPVDDRAQVGGITLRLAEARERIANNTVSRTVSAFERTRRIVLDHGDVFPMNL